MLVKFFHHGEGKADSAVRYLTASRPSDYLTGPRDAKGAVRNPAPAVVRGNASLTRRLINHLCDKKHRYVSGVLSFRELISAEAEQRIIDRFESTAFAGLRPGQFDCLWIRHAHNKRTELHFLVPRCELTTGKALNIRPPGRRTEEIYDTFRKLINVDFHLKDPDRSVARLTAEEVAALREKLQRLQAARAHYNIGRYPIAREEPRPALHPHPYEDRTRPLGGSSRTTPARTHESECRTRSATERLGVAIGAMGAACDEFARATVHFERSVGTFRTRAAEALKSRASERLSVFSRYGIPRAVGVKQGTELEPDELELDREG